GKIIKKAGFQQEMVYGNGLISVEWYASVREVVLGLEKNIYAGTDYRLWMVACGVAFHLVASLWPYLAIFITSGVAQWLYAATVMVITIIAADNARLHGLKPWYALGFPLTIGLFVFIIIRSVYCNLIQGGIYWRGTFYTLEKLRKNKI
ncbi:MAG: glycosyl transferase, partial [Gammaproteobacteria bacterium]|nr:glycosyl transferase [Gammaproteobacteria bacterium]NIR94935.1 glycosyl transferase [Gammaproteobacteria bacterium]NIW45529.1 glycosyl transferase [Gammaproteobacteria bacterium]NIX55689.1 glycosyl transferase [candidate division Zixibacteria bacterium]